jgi:DNA-binding transcriptional regulator LsrR (DeoR family)
MTRIAVPGPRGKRIPPEKYGEIVGLLRRGLTQAEVARRVDVSEVTVARYANDPVLAQDLKVIREQIKKLHVVRGADIQAKAYDLAEAQVGKSGDPRGFKDAMQGIEVLEKVTASASGENLKVEVTGMPPATNVDLKVLIAQLLGRNLDDTHVLGP